MARRSRKADASLFILLALFLLAYGVHEIFLYFNNAIVWAYIIIISIPTIFYAIKKIGEHRSLNSLKRDYNQAAYLATEIINSNKDQLIKSRRKIKYSELNKKNESIKWNKAKKDFIKQKIYPAIQKQLGISIEIPKIHQLIDSVTTNEQLSSSHLDEMNGIEYENHIAEKLRNLGWNAKTTKASGDQGFDVIAFKENLSIGVQCKFYQSAVGNGAVQEAIAGKIFYNIQHGIVITNSTFTKSAKELANKSDILLLHHNDIRRIESLIIKNQM